jgi:pyridoxine/pyridoxamine 5'-phosphate oxidase
MFAPSHLVGDGGFLPRFAGLDAQSMPVLRTRVPARLSAAASCQSRVVASRAVLEMQVPDRLRRHPGGAVVPRPRWGGFGVLLSHVEFWRKSPDGLHDRIRYRREPAAG